MQELPLGAPRREKDEPDRNFLEGEGFTSKGRERASLALTSETITKTQIQTASVPHTNPKLFFCKAGRRVNVHKDGLYKLLCGGRAISVPFGLEAAEEPEARRHTPGPHLHAVSAACFPQGHDLSSVTRCSLSQPDTDNPCALCPRSTHAHSTVTILHTVPLHSEKTPKDFPMFLKTGWHAWGCAPP